MEKNHQRFSMKYACYIVVVLALMLSSCQNRITIAGTVERNIDSITITKVLNDNSDAILDVVSVSHGKYSWTGTIDTTCIIRVYYGLGERDFARVIGEPGKIELNIPKLGGEQNHPKGTPLNDSITDYYIAVARMMERADMFYERVEEATSARERDSLEQIHNYLWKGVEQCKANYLNRHTDDLLGVYLLFDFQFYWHPELIEDAIKKMKKNFPDNFWVNLIGERVEGQMKGLPGQKYTNLTLTTPMGNQMSLSDIVPHNRYTLIYFWASWCNPCNSEIPYIKDVYNKYHDRGFDVVGISIDTQIESWRKSIVGNAIPWYNMSDLKGWSGQAAKTYGIVGIPRTFLIGQDGIIIEKDLRDNTLMKKMDELYTEKEEVASQET